MQRPTEAEKSPTELLRRSQSSVESLQGSKQRVVFRHRPAERVGPQSLAICRHFKISQLTLTKAGRQARELVNCGLVSSNSALARLSRPAEVGDHRVNRAGRMMMMMMNQALTRSHRSRRAGSYQATVLDPTRAVGQRERSISSAGRAPKLACLSLLSVALSRR